MFDISVIQGTNVMVKHECHLGGDHYTFKFENGYGASVIRNRYSYGGDQDLWELAVLDSNSHLCYDTAITDDVIGYLHENDVINILKKIQVLSTVSI